MTALGQDPPSAAGRDGSGPPGHDPFLGDPGLQPERTSLSWQRTALAGAGAALVCALAWARLGWPPAAVVTLALVGVPVLVGVLHTAPDRSGASPWPWLTAVVALAACLAVAGGAAALVGATR